MGAIAASASPQRYALFRDVLLASSSVPALFPPVVIETVSAGRTLRELHVDGGAAAALIAIPQAFIARDRSLPVNNHVELFLLVNEKLGGDFAMIDPNLVDIAMRALDLKVQSGLRERITTAYVWANDHHVDYRLTFIGADFDFGEHDRFDREYMRELYAYGLESGEAAQWMRRPPVGNELDGKR